VKRDHPPGIAGVSPAGGGDAGETPAIAGGRHPWRSRGYVPHFDGTNVQQNITFHLADSLPRAVVQRMEKELEQLPDHERTLSRRKRLHALLDAGIGSCCLRDPANARLMQQAFFHGDGERYHLLAWVVMPNHVHVLIEPVAGWALDRILHSWKSFTAHAILKATDREEDQRLVGDDPPGIAGVPSASTSSIRKPSRQFWHREYWDRFIRDEAHYRNVIDYLHQNPVKAGLVTRPEDWPWSSAGIWRPVGE
jgi:REP element-mobilizing transposase RayT